MSDQPPCGCKFRLGHDCECSILCGYCWSSFMEEQHAAAIAENEKWDEAWAATEHPVTLSRPKWPSIRVKARLRLKKDTNG